MDKVAWSAIPLRRFRHVFSRPRRLQYILWRLFKLGMPLVSRLSDGTWVAIRPRPASDLEVAYEVMFDRAYELPSDMSPNSVRAHCRPGGECRLLVLVVGEPLPEC
jgi:hypothetical protein